MFKKHFDRDVCDGDYIDCVVEGKYMVRAVINRTSDRPDKHLFDLPDRRDFKTRTRWLASCAEIALAKAAWENDEWWIGYITLHVAVRDPDLWDSQGPRVDWDLWDSTTYGPDIWMLVDGDVSNYGTEVNYPLIDRRWRPNTYLRDIANELLPEAMAAAKLVEHNELRRKLGLPAVSVIPKVDEAPAEGAAA